MVVGGGLAGARTVAELRGRGYAGHLTLLGAEPHLPYDRPPLSKGLLLGDIDHTTLEASYDGVELRLGERATALRDGVVETEHATLDADAIVLATGAVPVAVPGASTLRTVDDARRLRVALLPGAHVVILGAGWIGAEVATAALVRGCRVTVFEAAAAPLSTALGPEVGAATLPFWRDVDLRLETFVDDVAGLEADVVLAAVGVRPATGWAGHPDGVPVDPQLRAGPGVVAVGDAAAWQSGRFGTRLLVEHWDSALHAPATAAATLLGEPATYDPVPYFWSEQFGHTIQYAGWHGGADTLMWRREGDTWAALWTRDGALEAVACCDRPRDLLQARKAIAARAVVDPDRASDPSVALRAALLARA